MLRNTTQALDPTMLHGFTVVTLIISIIPIVRGAAVWVGIGRAK
jgi:hypothetical protein